MLTRRSAKKTETSCSSLEPHFVCEVRMRAVHVLVLLLLSRAEVCTSSSTQHEAVLALPVGQGGAALRLGQRVALEELGPVVVHADCTVHRVTNWANMTDAERATTRRRVVERNAARLEVCRELHADVPDVDKAEL